MAQELTRPPRHKFAAIGGGIEPEDDSPLAAALRELHEETKLTPKSLRLLCQGNPWTFEDPAVNYEFTVSPFSFYWPADAPEPLHLGWEHEGYTWFKPNEVRREDTAAAVIDSLRRLWPQGGLAEVDVLCRYCLGELAGSGGAIDARKDMAAAFGVFRAAVGELSSTDKTEWWDQVRLAAWHVWNCSHESISRPLLCYLARALRLLEQLMRAEDRERGAAFGELTATALVDIQAQLDKDIANGTLDDGIKDHSQRAGEIFSGLWGSP